MRYQSYENPVTFFDIVGAMFRFKWRAMFVTLVVMVVVTAGIFLFPKKYESEAKLFVRLGRGSASFDAATIGQTISIQESRETEMNSIIDMLQSRSLAEAVVDQVGVERLLKKYAIAEVKIEKWLDLASEQYRQWLPTEQLEGPQPSAAAKTDAELQQLERYELAIKQVQSNLKVDSPKKSTTIGIAFRAREPELAKDVVETAIEEYEKMHIAAYRSSGVFEFFDEQFAMTSEEVVANEEALRTKKNENAVVTMKGKMDSLQSEITDVKKMQLQTQADLRAAQARVEQLASDLNQLESEIVSQKTSGIASSATDTMRSRLYELELQEKELSSRYNDGDPRLERVREQLANAREIVDEQPTEVPQSVMAANPIRQQMENELLVAKAAESSLNAKAGALRELESELLERLGNVNDLEIQSEQMQRKIDTARDNYRSYARRLEESRINEALDEGALSNVSIVGEPKARYKHVSPRRSLLLALGALFSMLCGAMVALLSDYGRNAREMVTLRKAERALYLRRLQHAEQALARPPAIEDLELVGESTGGRNVTHVSSSKAGHADVGVASESYMHRSLNGPTDSGYDVDEASSDPQDDVPPKKAK